MLIPMMLSCCFDNLMYDDFIIFHAHAMRMECARQGYYLTIRLQWARSAFSCKISESQKKILGEGEGVSVGCHMR